MSDGNDTPMTAHSLGLRSKRNGRLALDLNGLTVERFAELVGVGPSLAKAWFNPTSSNQLPAWPFEHPAIPRAVRDDFRRLMAGEEPVRVLGAHTPEDQANVCTGRVGELLTSLAATLRDRKIDPTEARSLLPFVRSLRDALGHLEEHLVGLVARHERTRGAA